MPVPGCPELAACGPSMQSPRMTLMARCSRSGSETISVTVSTLATDGVANRVEEHDGSPESVKEAAPADRADLARAEHARGRAAGHGRVDDLRVVVGAAEQVGAASVAREHERAAGMAAAEEG